MKNFNLLTKATLDISEFFIKVEAQFKRLNVRPITIGATTYDMSYYQAKFNQAVNPILFQQNLDENLQAVKIDFFIGSFQKYKIEVHSKFSKEPHYNYHSFGRDQELFYQELQDTLLNWEANYTQFIEQSLLSSTVSKNTKSASKPVKKI